MVNGFKIICAFICVMITQTTSAVFFTGEVLKEDNVMLIILGDVHTTKANVITTQQKKDIVTFSKKSNAYLIVEDFTKHEGTDPKINIELEGLDQIAHKFNMAGLCDLCSRENIKSCSCEFRFSKSTDDVIKENEQTLNKLKAFDHPIAQKLLEIFWEKHNTLLAKNEYFKFNTDALFEFYTVYKFWKALQERSNTLFIIVVGAAHVRPISQLIQIILKFNSVLRKNYFKMPDFLGSPEKNKELSNKMEKITTDYALDLPQFFDEALKAQPIRSRL